jgi:hypothetical protein
MVMPWSSARRSPKVAEVLPVLYLRGLSTGDFREALAVLLGDDATGPPPKDAGRGQVWVGKPNLGSIERAGSSGAGRR